MATELKTASVLAFERKLDPSDALLFAGSWAGRESATSWPVVKRREKSVRGTISNRLKSKDQDPAKLDAAIENPNLQTVDVATLPADADTLKVQFTLRVLGGTGHPSACNDAAYRAKLITTVGSYVQLNGFSELARRYAANLANGRFLWRNRVGAEQVEVVVAHLKDGKPVTEWKFDALTHPMPELKASPGDAKALSELAEVIANGLAGSAHVLLQVTAFVRILIIDDLLLLSKDLSVIPASSLPRRQLRKMQSSVGHPSCCSLPRRQLRNSRGRWLAGYRSSLPRRQLRKLYAATVDARACSLPRRQLRKRTIRGILPPRRSLPRRQLRK